MNHQPTSTKINRNVPTFRSAEAIETRVIDITTLTESDISALRTTDPFMYYSIFKPTGNHCNEPKMVQRGGNEGPEADGMVARQTRISVECNATTVLMQMLEREDDAAIDDDGRDEDIWELAMLFEQ